MIQHATLNATLNATPAGNRQSDLIACHIVHGEVLVTRYPIVPSGADEERALEPPK
jgi:hypothetical protein